MERTGLFVVGMLLALLPIAIWRLNKCKGSLVSTRFYVPQPLSDAAAVCCDMPVSSKQVPPFQLCSVKPSKHKWDTTSGFLGGVTYECHISGNTRTMVSLWKEVSAASRLSACRPCLHLEQVSRQSENGTGIISVWVAQQPSAVTWSFCLLLAKLAGM